MIALTEVHGLTEAMLKDQPSTLHVITEFYLWLQVLNAKKILIVAQYGLGADKMHICIWYWFLWSDE